MGEYQYVTSCECGSSCPAGRGASNRADGVQIKCRTYGATTIPADTEVGTVFPLVNVNVDNKGRKNTCVKVEFLSNILTATATATLNFQAYRQCDGQLTPVPVSSIWTFSRTVATNAEANSFGFTFCDCDNCNCGCCNYSVVATVVGAATTGTVTINNATVMATVVEDSAC